MNIQRRTFVGVLSALAGGQAMSQSWPTRTIKLVVPFAAGGPTDFIARLLSTPLSEALGQSVIVENRPGASGNLGARYVAESTDGHTILHNTVGMQAVNPLMYKNAKFDPAKDLVPLGITAAMPNVLVAHPTKLNVKSVAELVAKAKERRDNLSYATFGQGTSPHIYGALLQKLGGFSAVAVPYKGSGPAITDVIGGQVDFLFDSMTTCVGQIQGGTLRGLAITSSTRSQLIPNVPTLEEAGFPAIDLKFWFSLQAPASIPETVRNRLQQAVSRAIADKGYLDALAARGAEPLSVEPTEVRAFVAQDTQRWVAVAKTLDIKSE